MVIVSSHKWIESNHYQYYGVWDEDVFQRGGFGVSRSKKDLRKTHCLMYILQENPCWNELIDNMKSINARWLFMCKVTKCSNCYVKSVKDKLHSLHLNFNCFFFFFWKYEQFHDTLPPCQKGFKTGNENMLNPILLVDAWRDPYNRPY